MSSKTWWTSDNSCPYHFNDLEHRFPSTVFHSKGNIATKQFSSPHYCYPHYMYCHIIRTNESKWKYRMSSCHAINKSPSRGNLGQLSTHPKSFFSEKWISFLPAGKRRGRLGTPGKPMSGLLWATATTLRQTDGKERRQNRQGTDSLNDASFVDEISWACNHSSMTKLRWLRWNGDHKSRNQWTNFTDGCTLLGQDA